MKCLIARNSRLSGAVMACWLAGCTLAQAEITHTQLESYDFATDQHQLSDINIDYTDAGNLRITSVPQAKPELALTTDYRMCLNKAGTQGYLRILGEAPSADASAAQAPLVKFAHEQDLHLALTPLPAGRRLIFFADTTDLWVIEDGATLESNPDCKR